jgi:outer membrane protein
VIALATIAVGAALSLQDAMATALDRQPSLLQARQQAKAAVARTGIALAPVLPQLNGTGSYVRTTANFVARPGSVPQSLINGATGPDLGRTYDFWSFGLTLSQSVFDLGAIERWMAARSTAESARATELATRVQIVANVRSAYFAVIAQNELLHVASETLVNQRRHREQIEGFVRVGTRPEIDLAQAKSDEANAEVLEINANVNLAVSKAQLNQAMGVTRDTAYSVEEDDMPPVDGEAWSADVLLDTAIQGRPDLKAIAEQIKAQSQTVVATYGGYAPTLGASATFTEAGINIGAMMPNWNVGMTATWNFFGGLGTYQSTREAKATESALGAQRETLLQQMRVDIERTRLNVQAMKAALRASEVALTSAKERLRLAEGRYTNGAGNVVELGDAQIAATNAGAQKVQARFNLALARAQLLQALGRED